MDDIAIGAENRLDLEMVSPNYAVSEAPPATASTGPDGKGGSGQGASEVEKGLLEDEDHDEDTDYDEDTDSEDLLLNPFQEAEFKMSCGILNANLNRYSSEDGYDKAKQLHLQKGLMRSELPSMTFMEGKLWTSIGYKVYTYGPLMQITLSRPNQIDTRFVHFGHLGSALIDNLVSTIPHMRYRSEGIAVLDYFEKYGWPWHEGVFTSSKWRAPSHNPDIHQILTFDRVSWSKFSRSRAYSVIRQAPWNHYLERVGCTRDSANPAADPVFQATLANITRQNLPPQNSHLLKLPEELQLKIWKYAITSSKRVRVASPTFIEHFSLPSYVTGFYNKPAWCSGSVKSYKQLAHNLPAGASLCKVADIEHKMRGNLCLVNRYLYSQISGEAAYRNNLMFFSSNAFTIPGDTRPAAVGDWARCLSFGQLRAIKDLDIPFDFCHLPDQNNFLNILKRFRGLQHLTITIDVFSPWFHRSHKDYRLDKLLGSADKVFELWTSGEIPGLPILQMRGLKSFLLRPRESWRPEACTPEPPFYKLKAKRTIWDLDDPEKGPVEEEYEYEMSYMEVVAKIRAEFKEVSDKIEAIVTQPVGSV